MAENNSTQQSQDQTASQQAPAQDKKQSTTKASQQAPAQDKMANDKTMIGNQDTEEKYPFDKSWGKGIVVKQSNNVPGRPDIEDPLTVAIKVYEPDVFENLTRTGGFKGYNVQILHDPRK